MLAGCCDASDTTPKDGDGPVDASGSGLDVSSPTDGGDASPPNDAVGMSDGSQPDATNARDGSTDGARTDAPFDVRRDGPICIAPPAIPTVCFDIDGGSAATPSGECGNLGRTFVQTDFPEAMIADSQGVYWMGAGGQITMVPTGATAPSAIVTTSGATHYPFFLDDDAIFFVEDVDGGQFAISRIRRDGSGRATLAYGTSGIEAMTSDRLYFRHASGQMAWVAKTGGATFPTPITAAELRGFLVDETQLYWFDGPASNAALKRIFKDSDAIETIAEQQGPIRSFLQDATHLYWFEGTETTAIKGVAKGGMGFETLATQLGRTGQVIEQGDSLLFSLDNQLVEVPKAGGCPRVLANLPIGSGVGAVSLRLAADATEIYVRAGFSSSLGEVNIWRVPRTGGQMLRLRKMDFVAPGGSPSVALTPTQFWWLLDKSVEVLDRP